MCPSALFTVPEPDPAVVMLSVGLDGPEKSAPTSWSVSMAMGHLPLPEQSPVHVIKCEPRSGLGVSVTVCPGENVALQLLAGQSIPLGRLCTDPAPVTVTVSVGVAKSAVTLWFASMVNVHAPVPAQSPVHDVNVAPAFAFGLRVTV